MGGSILAHGEKTFESYLQDTQYNAIFAALKSYIYKNRQRLNLSTRIVPDPDYHELDDIHVMGVTFKEGEGDRICSGQLCRRMSSLEERATVIMRRTWSHPGLPWPSPIPP